MTARWMLITAICTLTLIPAGCGTPPAERSHHRTAIRDTPLEHLPTATLPDGARITLELAITPEEHQKGLMFRPFLSHDRGMLFLFKTDGIPSFWMKNTLIPLDIIFLDDAGRVVSAAVDVPPCAAEPCPLYRPTGPSRAVLEVAAGTAKAHGLVPGAIITFARVPEYPLAPPAP
ncbi:MAG: DUF192 domain-containing protein [Acidobacteria bacterium]|nr:DUF192 domain-containing protein [Acidobacteriota bacterium]